MSLAYAGLVEDDPHDRALRAAVFPADWVTPTPPARYDLVVVGGGPAGLVAAAAGAGLGGRVAMIERHLLGGDCLNYGCVPSKALLHVARLAHAGRQAALLAGAPAPTIPFTAALDWVRDRRAHIGHHDAATRFRDLGVDVYLGSAAFVGPDRVRVGDHTLRFSRAIIATGARPALPPVPGLAEAGVLTNETVFALRELPRRLVVIGAGPIGCELAQALARLGSQVTVVARDPRVLPRDDVDAATVVERRLRAEGVRFELGVTLAAVGRRGQVRVVSAERAGVLLELEADQVLVAAGRRPNVDGLGLDAAGVAFDQRGVTVDDRLRTRNRRILAAGDVCSRYQFTHSADALARIAIRNAFFFGRARVSALHVPWATYTDPEVAQVGLTGAEAEAAGHRTYTVSLRELDRAIVEGDEDGFVRAYVDRKGRIRGATIVGHGAGDLIGEVTLAMTAGLRLGVLSSTIHPYPTRGEALRKLGDAFQRDRVTPAVRRWLGRIMRWRR